MFLFFKICFSIVYRSCNRFWCFDYAKLDWFNGEYFKKMTDFTFSKAARHFAGELTDDLDKKWLYAAGLLRPRVSRYGEIPAQIAFFRTLPEYEGDLFLNKRNKVTKELAEQVLTAAVTELGKIPDWTPYALDSTLEGIAANHQLTTGAVMWPLRIALSGQKVTPGGVTEILYLLGGEESIKRLEKGLAKLKDL